jgi:hypothetical protein
MRRGVRWDSLGIRGVWVRRWIHISLGFLLVFALGLAFFATSGKSVGTYKSLDGTESLVECRYHPFSKDCVVAPKLSIGGKKFFLTHSVKVDAFEEGSGFVLGWDKKNFCLTEGGEVVQIKSEQAGLRCESDAVLVGKNECYRQDYRDVVDYCD